MRKKKPIVALMYDFDKTLCTKDMQEYTFIPNVGMDPNDFWKESGQLSKTKKMDAILGYMHVMLEKAHAAKVSIRREEFVKMGQDLQFFPGVEGWFERINSIGKDLGLNVEHYIISSGLHEIIEGSNIYKEFKEVFACEYLYDENDVACWPKNAVNYTTKTQFLFRINKGVLDISNDGDLNSYTPEEDRRVPFGNMVYIGDGLTDVPCMKLVKVNGALTLSHLCSLRCAQSLQSCLTLCDPMDCSPPGSSVHGILQVRILGCVAISSSRGSSQSRDQTSISCFLHWQVGSSPPAPLGSLA